MNFELIFSILFKIGAFGCIFAILWFMFKKVEDMVPEPFKEVIGWLRLFVILLCGAAAIIFIADMAGISTTNGSLSLK